MFVMICYAIGFFIFTIVLQYVTYKMKKGYNQLGFLWSGISVVIALCVLGFTTQKITYFAAIIGFMAADVIGKKLGWHK